MLHTYQLSKEVALVDAPGFGFTSGVEKKRVDSWRRLIQLYLKRGCSRMALCLVDAEHGFKDTDLSLLKYLDTMKKQYMIVYTKCDKKMPDTQVLKTL